jgi:tripartite-type tricarboxylate transporter receptor subunit TctC
MTFASPLRRRRAVGGLIALAAAPFAARAADWPSKPVHIAVPAPAGSSLDIVARLLGEHLAARWGQPVVVDNRPGAGGLIGTDVAAKAAPDGHTLTLSFNGPIAFAPFLYRKLPYDAARDLVPVVMTTSQPNVLAVNAAKVPVKTVKEFVDWAKAARGAVNYASLGNGSSAHLTMELFMAEAGFQATHIPFNGSPPAALAVAQGEADAVFMVAPALLPHVRAGKVRLIAVSSAQPVESLKDLPTLASTGYAAVESMAWNGLFAPSATPAAVIAKINADVNAVLAEPAVRTALDAQGLTPVGGSAVEFRHLVEAEQKRWGPIIRKIGITLD